MAMVQTSKVGEIFKRKRYAEISVLLLLLLYVCMGVCVCICLSVFSAAFEPSKPYTIFHELFT